MVSNIPVSFPAVLILLAAASANAQFSGDFSIEKHFIEEENFLDWKAYQDTIPSRYAWYECENGIKTTTGSLSQERFYHHHEIRLGFDFSDYASFFYEQKKDEFYSREPLYHEAEFRFGKTYGFSLIGYPFHEKRYNNAGIALSHGKRSGFEYMRLSYLRIHAGFNELNKRDEKLSGNERYVDEPVLYRFEAKYKIRERLLVECDLAYEPDAGLSVPDENAEKTYTGYDYFVRFDWIIDSRWLAGVSYRTVRQERGFESAAGPDYTVQVMSLDSLDIYAGARLTDRDHLAFGFLDSSFSNDIDSSDPQELYGFIMTCPQIYCIWLNTRSDKRKMLYSLQAGTYDIYKEDRGAVDTDDRGIDIKAGVGIILYEDKRYRFLALSTWDLDLFIDRQWDGGNIQLQVHF